MVEHNIGQFKFYYVDETYVDFLKSYDARVPNVSGPDYKHNKFFIGVILSVGDKNYFAPISSYTETNDVTFNIKGQGNHIISSIRMNYMFPVADGTYKELSFDKLEPGYRELCNGELRFCNRNQKEIIELARNIYNKQVNDDYTDKYEKLTYLKMCCNYKNLEQGVRDYFITKNVVPNPKNFVEVFDVRCVAAKKPVSNLRPFECLKSGKTYFGVVDIKNGRKFRLVPTNATKTIMARNGQVYITHVSPEFVDDDIFSAKQAKGHKSTVSNIANRLGIPSATILRENAQYMASKRSPHAQKQATKSTVRTQEKTNAKPTTKAKKPNDKSR
jgi:protein AbiQ